MRDTHSSLLVHLVIPESWDHYTREVPTLWGREQTGLDTWRSHGELKIHEEGDHRATVTTFTRLDLGRGQGLGKWSWTEGRMYL